MQTDRAPLRDDGIDLAFCLPYGAGARADDTALEPHGTRLKFDVDVRTSKLAVKGSEALPQGYGYTLLLSGHRCYGRACSQSVGRGGVLFGEGEDQAHGVVPSGFE